MVIYLPNNSVIGRQVRTMTVVQRPNRQVMDMGMPERRCARRSLGPDPVTVLTITAAALSSRAFAADPASARKRGGEPI